MVALVLEDGTGVAGANSYATVAEADDYFSTHPFYADMWDAQGIPDRANLLVSASGQLDALMRWFGTIAYDPQGLGWPRIGVYDPEGRLLPSTEVPSQVKTATFELAVYASRGDPFAPLSSFGVDKLKIDVIEMDFTPSIVRPPVPAAALLAVRGLGDYVYGMRVRKVMVG